MSDPLLEMKLRDLGVQVDAPAAKAATPETDDEQR
jgi:hypothetical protein